MLNYIFQRPGNPIAPMSAIIKRKSLPQRWCQDIVLSDGRDLRLRPIEPEDAEALRRGFELLNPEEVRLRFMHPMREMTPAFARKLTQLNPKRDFAIVAAEPLPPGEGLIGAVVRASISDDGRRAEFAIIVARVLAGQGLGRLLMKQIIRWAKLKRLDELYGDVLDENTSMLNLAAALGFKHEHVEDDPGIIRVRLALRTKVAKH